MKTDGDECLPEKGDPVTVSVPGRVFGLHEQRGVPGAFVRAGGNDYWFPLTDLMPENSGWVADATTYPR